MRLIHAEGSGGFLGGEPGVVRYPCFFVIIGLCLFLFGAHRGDPQEGPPWGDPQRPPRDPGSILS